jgi:hypothetical protein
MITITVLVVVVGLGLLAGGLTALVAPKVVFKMISAFSFVSLSAHAPLYLVFYRIMGVILIVAAVVMLWAWFLDPAR